MGGPSGGSGGGNDRSSAVNVPPSRRKYQPVTGSLADPRETDDTAAKMDLFYERGATKLDNQFKTPAVAFLSGPLKAGSRKNREFFTDKVLGSKNYKGTTKADFQKLSATQQEQMYDTYMSNRQSGATDAYGNKLSTRDNQGGGSYIDPNKSMAQPKVASQMDNTGVKSDLITAKGPTTAEMSEDQNMINIKRRGRKTTTLTDKTENVKPTLSKKILLGN